MRKWLADKIGSVRIRQLLEEYQHRLAFVPLVMTAVAVVGSQLTLWIDRAIDDQRLPSALTTTVDGAQAVLSTIAGGLITAFTLLVSMTLVAVQLASGQFSPRTLRNWLGDPMLRRAVGLVMATTVYCLLALRSARDFGEDPVIPHLTVIVAVTLGVASLVMVIRAVDHVTNNLQVGSVARRIADETVGVIEAVGGAGAGEHPQLTPASRPNNADTASEHEAPTSAVVVESQGCGWVQQIDTTALSEALPEGSRAWVSVIHGAYVPNRSPLVRVEIAGGDDTQGQQGAGAIDDELADRIRSAFALGGSRTMQRDVGFGLSQLADIAVRALSPGVNDPQTAQDITRHLGDVLLTLWSYDEESPVADESRCTIYQITTGHRAHLRAALDPIRRYGKSDPEVMQTLALTIAEMADEVTRRNLPGPVEPLHDMLSELAKAADDNDWLPRERDELRRATR